MHIRDEFQDGVLYLYLSGELDHHAARTAMVSIEEKISRYLPRSCRMDLEKLSFMDSSGIAVILKTYRRVHEIGGRMQVTRVPEQPMKVLDASGLDRIIEISPIGQEEYI